MSEAETAERQENKLTLGDMESVIAMHAKPVAQLYGVRPHQYKIHLATKARGIMMLQSGPCVQITLQFPDALSQVNTLLREAFKLIRERDMISIWAIEPVAMIMKRTEEKRQWYRETFGDEFEIMADLLPKQRLRASTRVTHTLTLTDKETGISVTTDYEPDRRTKWEVEQETRVKLSRIVRQYEEMQNANSSDS